MKFVVLAMYALKAYLCSKSTKTKKQSIIGNFHSPKIILGSIFLTLISFLSFGQISVTFPVPRAVIQRNNANQANLNIAGHINIVVDRIEARLLPRTEQARLDTITATAWQTVQQNPVNFFSGSIAAKGGWYNLEIRAIKDSSVVGNVTTIERVGIGEVFVYIGHSNAQGGAYGQTGPNANDDRVSCIATGQEPSCNGLYPFQPASSSDSLWCKYLQTGDALYLPVLKFSKVSIASGISPFCGRPWFWSIVGDSLSRKLNVPIMLYGAAFGGTKSEHWYKAAKGILFDHGFIKSSIGMPYVNLKNVLQLYVPLTGIRSVLCLHGVNERNDSQADIQTWMEGYIAQSRIDSKIPDLAWMIALDSYLLDHNLSPAPYPLKFDPRNAQTAVAQQPYNFQGPDLDVITDNGGGIIVSERPDGLHFGNQGLISAANLWINAINKPSFFRSSNPKLSQSFAIQSAQSGKWQKANSWNCNCFPQNYHSMLVQPNHTIEIDALKVKPLSIILQGNLSFINQSILGF
ncbi:MAG: hypothetical protein V4585_15980 [Bacteroidota bacterium]